MTRTGWVRVRWTYLALGVLTVGYFASTLLRSSGTHIFWLDDVLTNVIQVCAALLCIVRAIRVPAYRPAWTALGAGLLLWSLGDVYWVLTFNTDESPGPSIADLCYLAFYPLAYLTIVQLLRARTPRFPPALWWDGLVVAFGAAAMASAFAFDTIYHAGQGSALTVVVNLAYPIGDLILLMMIVGVLTLLRGRIELRWLLFAAGGLLFAFADSGYLFAVARGDYRTGGMLDALWPAAIVIMSWSAWCRPRRLAPLEIHNSFLIAAPITAAGASGAILIYGNIHALNPLDVALAAGALAAAGVRMALGVRDAHRLGESRRQAVTDELTGLGNRRLLMQELNSLLCTPQATRRLALLLVDLDRFKEVNDAFGHHVGDELLTHLGPRLKAVLRERDVLVRLGGDEFAVALIGADSDHALAVAHRICTTLSEPFALQQVSVHVGASVGVALAPEHATSSAELLRCADIAMYRAKADHSEVTVYDQSSDHSLDRLQLLEELRQAVERDEIDVHYQPKVELTTGRVVSVEALARWSRPSGEPIPPDVFIPLAEDVRLMRPLTQQVLRKALADCARWNAAGIHVSVAVNMSSTNLLDDALPSRVSKLLAEHRVPANSLIIEITESILITDPQQALEVVRQLHELGIRISVDDFGTGFSSLSYLRDLPVDELKLDRTFVARLGATCTQRDQAIASSALALGHALGLSVVAEGVEESSTAVVLARLGFDAAQGYYFGQPVPAAALAFTDDSLPSDALIQT